MWFRQEEFHTLPAMCTKGLRQDRSIWSDVASSLSFFRAGFVAYYQSPLRLLACLSSGLHVTNLTEVSLCRWYHAFVPQVPHSIYKKGKIATHFFFRFRFI